MSRTYYMHTINGRPGAFSPENGICHMNFYGKPNPLCVSLKQIRVEQRASALIRAKCGFTLTFDLGYRRVRTP